MRAFIIRPFGTKAGIDFDKVEHELIDPVLAATGIQGRTTGEIVASGNIREDMFQLLLISDLVIADISIHNANAYYELGIRHALREKRTFLIRAKGSNTEEVPFDLRTDRYFAYDINRLEQAVPALQQAILETIRSERQDSPVFRLLPDLRENDLSRFAPVPMGFREEVKLAGKSGQPGKLTLLAEEARGMVWEGEGLRHVGREQFNIRDFPGARKTFEELLAILEFDKEANLLLGTIYQRLGDLERSELVLRRVSGHPHATPAERAEAFALIGRNLKSRWRETWEKLDRDKRPATALRSSLLLQSYEAYLRAFRQDLNHFYSGLNALFMLTLVLELAEKLPEAWSGRFAGGDEAARNKADLQIQHRTLAGAVEFSIGAARQSRIQVGQTDPWIEVSHADLQLLTTSRAEPVAFAYEQALQGQSEFVTSAVRGQLQLFSDLGLFSEKVAAVQGVLPPERAGAAVETKPAKTRVMLFTGHRIDDAGRTIPRFPAAKEGVAREAIKQAVSREKERSPSLLGMAGAASGGDILFHEVCAELGIPTRLYLTLPPGAYVAASVASAGPDWVRRFFDLYSLHPSAPVLSDTQTPPGWLSKKPAYSIWQRNNLWLLYEALAPGPENVTVIALWNGATGDGPGGTEHMIGIARERGARVEILDTKRIFGGGPKE